MKKSAKSKENAAPKMVVGLDIGTTKIMMVMGYLRDDGKVEICGYGKAPSSGVEYGLVFNVKRTTNSILEAAADLKANVDQEFSDVYVGVAGRHIKSRACTNSTTRPNGLEKLVEDEEIDKMTEELEQYSIPGCDIISVIPQYYEVDGTRTMTPAGTLAQKVVGSYQIITGDTQEVRKIKLATNSADLNLRSLMLEPVASSIVCLTEEEKKQGVALVDIGGGTTDVIIFESGVPLFIKVIPVGGQIVTRDIQSLGLSYEQAEAIKVKHGTCFVDNANKNDFITIPEQAGYTESRKISEFNLSQIINARVANDILGAVKKEIDASGYGDKVHSIVLTGGGALMRDIQILSEYIIMRKTRIGMPVHGFVSVESALIDPTCSTALGLLRAGCVNEAAPFSGSVEQETPAKPKKSPTGGVTISTTAGSTAIKFFDVVKGWLKSLTFDDTEGVD